jgi:hypothetical protein
MSDRTKQNDFDDLDSLEAQLPRLIASGELKEAARRAIADQLARGIPVTFQRGEAIVKVYPDGREEILGRVPQRTYRIPPDVTVVEPR